MSRATMRRPRLPLVPGAWTARSSPARTARMIDLFEVEHSLATSAKVSRIRSSVETAARSVA